MVRDDYLERMIKQLAEALARVLRLSSEGKGAEATREVDGCYLSLGVSRSMLSKLDASTLSTLIGAAKSGALADVLDVDAVLLQAEGRDAEAAARTRDAQSLRQGSGH